MSQWWWQHYDCAFVDVYDTDDDNHYENTTDENAVVGKNDNDDDNPNDYTSDMTMMIMIILRLYKCW